MYKDTLQVLVPQLQQHLLSLDLYRGCLSHRTECSVPWVRLILAKHIILSPLIS